MIETDQPVVPGIVILSTIKQFQKLTGTNAQINNPRLIGFRVPQFKGLTEAESLRIEADGFIHVSDCNCGMCDTLDHKLPPVLSQR